MIAGQQQPRAQGDLSATPFAHVVLDLHKEGSSGTLVIDGGGFEIKVLFRNGRAVAARPLPRGTGLQDGLRGLCDLSEGHYAFWEGDLLGDSSGVVKGTVDPLLLVAESLRGHVRSSVVRAVIEAHRGRRLHLTRDADPKRLGLRGLEARAVERLRVQPMMAEDFLTRCELVPDEAKKLLYLLLITQYAAPEGGGATGTSGVRAAVSSLPPTQPSMPPPVPSVHPSLPTSSNPPRTQSSVPAWQQLASMRASAQRQSSPSIRIPTPSMAPLPVEMLDDAGKLARAEQLIEHRNYEEAARIATDLVTRVTNNPDYQALQASVLYHQLAGNKPTRALIDAIESTLRLKAEHPRGLYLKGLVLKRLGRQAEALRYFEKAVEADPKHLDAQRELRLSKMRSDR